MPEMKDDEWNVKLKPEEYKLVMRKWIKLRVDGSYPDSETDPTTQVRMELAGSTHTVEARAGTASDGPVVTLEDASGQGKIELKVGQNSLLIDKQQIELKVGQNSIVLNQSGITVKGMTITLQGQVKVEVKAPTVQASADGMLQLQGSGMAELKGGVVMIN